MWSWDEFANRAISLQISPALAGKEAHPAVAARVTSSVFLIRLFIETPRRLRRLLLARRLSQTGLLEAVRPFPLQTCSHSAACRGWRTGRVSRPWWVAAWH